MSQSAQQSTKRVFCLRWKENHFLPKKEQTPMPKFLIQASYTAEGLKGLQKDKASGRKAAISKAIEGLEGKLDAMYYAFGDDDVIVIVDMPDNVSATALSLAASASGLVRTKTTPLITVEETDRALQKSVNYRAPGK
jgi:uncharacterized protein with GYD domain